MNDFSIIKEKVIPYFIKIYGEEYRDLIIERINKIVPIFYETAEILEKDYYYKLSMKKNELTLKFLEMNDMFVSEETIDDVLRDNKASYLSNNSKIEFFLKACFNDNRYNPNNNLKNLIKEPYNNDNLEVILKNIQIINELGIALFFEDYNDWFFSNKSKIVFKEIDKILKTIEVLDLEYKNFKKSNKEIEDYIFRSSKVKNQCKDIVFFEYLNYIKEYLSDKYREEIDTFSIENLHSFKSTSKVIKALGPSIDSNGFLYAFTSDVKRILEKPQISKFQKNEIVEKQLEYYKFIGVYDEEIEDFLNSEIAIEYAPNVKFVDFLFETKRDFKKIYDEEVLNLTSTYQSNIEMMNSFKINPNKEEISLLSNQTICVCARLNQEQETTALLFFSEKAIPKNTVDVTLIHEINHALELSLVSSFENKTIFKIGFEIFLKNEPKKHNAFSEVINELIAKEVTEAMHKDGVYIFDNPKYAEIYDTSTYEKNAIVTYNFFSEFKNVILKSRLENNLDSLYEVVGKENFEELNDIVNEHNTIPFYAFWKDLNDEKTTALTIKSDELKEKADEVVKNMIEYSKLNKIKK